MAQTPPPKLRVQRQPFATPRAVVALILREISTTYGRSAGGYIWAILEPAAGIALLSLIFSVAFDNPPLGTDFAFFYASGLLPFLMYNDLSTKLGQTIQFSRALLEYPRVTFVDALLARLILNSLTQIFVHFIVLGLIILIQSPDTSLDPIKILQAYMMVLALSIGVGTLNSFLMCSYPVWQSIWSVVNRPLFLASCIFFTFETVPQPYSDYLWYNPLIHPIGMMREGYFPYYDTSYISLIYPCALGGILTMVGLFLLYHYHRDILDK